MKRVRTWVYCLLTAMSALPVLGVGTVLPWEQVEVYGTHVKGGLQLTRWRAWVLPRADILSITTYQNGQAELLCVNKQFEREKQVVNLPEEVSRIAARETLPDYVENDDFLSRTTRTIQNVDENGGVIYCVADDSFRRPMNLRGIGLDGLVPDRCTLLPRDGKIAVLFRSVSETSPSLYYVASFDVASGKMISPPVAVEENVHGSSLLWIDDTTLASTIVGMNGGFWSILNLQTGKVLASGRQDRDASHFIVLREGLYAGSDRGRWSCLYAKSRQTSDPAKR